MESTCGRAKSNIQDDTLSPNQKTPHKATAMPSPSKTFGKLHFTSRHQPGLNKVANTDSVSAEPVIIHQKFTKGAVQGENMTVHSTAASRMVKISFFMTANRLQRTTT